MPDTSTPQDLTITIDGKELDARPGELVIAAAERHGIYIPRFCYHPRMESVGMCRMCLVEIDTGRGPALQPSCMISVAPGMTVDTESAVTKKAQDGILEFLLINHPLDCPVCDKGGECPLQDHTLSFGPGESRFVEEKRHYEKPIAISETVYLDRERCILCDRCTRFAKEVAGDPLIHFQDRGSSTQVNTFPDEPFSSYFSGNTVQICPVGALTATPYRFKARPWDLEQSESTCTSCSVGCRIVIDSSRNRVLRYNGVDSDPVNWGWLCDKGRFDFESVDSDERLGAPHVRRGDDLVRVGWAEALDRAAGALSSAVQSSGPGGVAVLGGARLTNESAYAWAKLAKGVIGTDHVDAQLGDGLPADLVLGLPRTTIDEAFAPGSTVLWLGPDPKEELPVLFLRLRHAVRYDGVKLVELSPAATGITELATASLRYRPGEAADIVAALVDGDAAPDTVDAAALATASELVRGGDLTMVVGRPSLAESADTVVAAAAYLFDALPDTRFLPALRRANVHGALDAGLAPGVLPGRVGLDAGREWFASAWPTVPAEPGLDALGILRAAADGRIDTLVLVGADPLTDVPDRDLATRALAAVRTVIAVDQFVTPSSARADVVLPAAGFAEVTGTTTNLEGRVSIVTQKVTPPGTARADWIIAAELALRLGADLGFESAADAWDELVALGPSHEGIDRSLLEGPAAADGVAVPLPRAAAPAAASDSADQASADDEAGDADPGVDADSGADGGDGEVDVPVEPAGPERPAPLRFVAPTTVPDIPTVDAYSFRLVSSRRLYDQGTLVQHSPAISVLAEPAVLRLNPTDLDRLGATGGGRVTIVTSRTSTTADAVPDPSVPRGSAVVVFNQDGLCAADLIDADAPVNDLRVESTS